MSGATRKSARIRRVHAAREFPPGALAFWCFSGRYIRSFLLEADTDLGKGDQRTKKGKRFRGTHGKTRPRKKKKAAQKKG